MAYTPTSAPGIALHQLRRMVALSAAFRAAVCVTTEAQALSKIGIGRVAAPVAGARIWLDNESPVTWELWGGGEQNHLKPRGTIALQLMFAVSESDDVETRYLKGLDAAAGTAAEVAALANAEDPQHRFEQNHLGVVRLDTAHASLAEPMHDHSRGLLFVAKLRVEWGDGV